MSDDDKPWFAPGYKPPPRVVSRSNELIWTAHRNHAIYTCELRYHGENDVEAQILKNAEFLVSQRFPTRAQAVAWSEAERKARFPSGEEF